MNDDEELLRRFLLGELGAEEAEAVERRMLEDDAFFEQAEAIERDVLADCARGGLTAAQKERVRCRLEASPEGQARLALAEDLTTLSRSGLELCEALLRRSWDLRTEDPRTMLRLAREAVDRAAALDPEQHGAAAVADLRCRAMINLANAYRVSDQLPQAEASLAAAGRLVPEGAEGDLLRARFLSIKASLLCDLRRFPEAYDALDTAYKIHRAHGDDHMAGRILIVKGSHAYAAHDLEGAARLLTTGLALIDTAREPWLVLAATHNLIRCLVDRGEHRKARRLLRRNLWRYERYGGALDLLRLRWTEAEISAGLGRLEEGERELAAVRAELIAAGLPYLAAVVALDLGWVHLHQGKADMAREVVREAAEVFTTLKIDREALTALLFLEKTAELEVATAGVLLRRVADFLRRAENDPEAKFSSPAVPA